jgi:hypothetical protein
MTGLSSIGTGPVEAIRFGTATAYCATVLDTDGVAQAEDLVARVPRDLVRVASESRSSGMATIGEALYRNRDRYDAYTAAARAENRRLYTWFRPVHEATARFFERWSGIPVAYVDELSVPGWHVFAYSRAGAYDGGGWHFDRLPAQVPYLVAHADEIRGIVNFTLPVTVPSGGTGMELRSDEFGSGRPGSGERALIPYRPGVLVFTDRDYWHRIGPSVCLRDGERRVTLQGHGVVFRGRLLLFW